MRRLCLCVLSLLLVSVVSAQTPEPVVSRDVAFWAQGVDPNLPGSVSLTGVTNVPNNQVTCNLTKATVPPGVLVNPTIIRFDDPADITKDCAVNAAVAAPLFLAVPFGTGIRVGVRARGATTISTWTLSNPFDRAAVPVVAVTNVRVL